VGLGFVLHDMPYVCGYRLTDWASEIFYIFAVLLINNINAQIEFLDFLNVINLAKDFSGSSHGEI
jgi:hypothetical protein